MPGASAKGIKAGQAFVRLFADDGPLRAALAKARAYLEKWGKGLSTIGAGILAAGTAAGAALFAAAKSFSDSGDALAKMAGRTGVGVEALGELKHAADLSGTSIDDVEAALRKQSRTVTDAANGSSAATDALAELGITAADIASMSPEETFLAIADGLAAIEDPARRAAMAQEVWGRSATSLLPLIAGGAAGIREMREEARALGLVMSQDDATAAEALNDAMGRVTSTLARVVNVIGAAVAPVLTAIADKAAVIIAQGIAWIDTNRGLVVGIAAAAAAAVALGGALVGLGTALTVAGAALGVVSAGIGLLVSPWALIAGGVIGVVFALERFTGVVSTLLSAAAPRFAELRDVAGRSFAAIAAALSAGNIQGAAEVLWSSLKLAWVAGTVELRTIWEGSLNSLLEAFAYIWVAARKAFGDFISSIIGAWDNATSYLAKRMTELSQVFQLAWSQITGDEAGAAAIRDQVSGAVSAIEDARQKSEADRKAADAARAESLRREFGGIVDVLDAATAAKIQQAQRELDAARAELDAAIAASGTTAAEAAEASAGAAARVAASSESVTSGPQVGGTFSAANLSRILGRTGNEQQRTASATERTALLLERIDGRPGAVFG